jgi:hypothetical protein
VLPEGEERKPPPDAVMLFETIFDTIEERHLTELGVEAMGEGGEGSEYQAVRELFRERFPAQLRELLKKTRRAGGGFFESEEEANDVSGFGWAGWSVGMHRSLSIQGYFCSSSSSFSSYLAKSSS